MVENGIGAAVGLEERRKEARKEREERKMPG
jgi:hypothetical protein